MSTRTVAYEEFDAGEERLREALTSTGYFCARGSFARRHTGRGEP